MKSPKLIMVAACVQYILGEYVRMGENVIGVNRSRNEKHAVVFSSAKPSWPFRIRLSTRRAGKKEVGANLQNLCRPPARTCLRFPPRRVGTICIGRRDRRLDLAMRSNVNC